MWLPDTKTITSICLAQVQSSEKQGLKLTKLISQGCMKILSNIHKWPGKLKGNKKVLIR